MSTADPSPTPPAPPTGTPEAGAPDPSPAASPEESPDESSDEAPESPEASPTPPTTLLSASSSAMAALPGAGRAASSADLGALLDGRRGAETVVLGPGLDVADVVELVQRYRVWRPEVGFVLERHHLAAEESALAVAAGVRDVVVVGDLGGLTAAVARSAPAAVLPARPPAPETPRGHVTTVFSAKGGSGVTTLCTNLAAALADGGRRSVVLVDLDLAHGDVAATLGLSTAGGLADAAPIEALTRARLLDMLTPCAPGLSALLSPARPGAAAAMTPELVERVLQLLGDSFDHVVVDTPTSLDATVLAATTASDTVLLLTTPEVPALARLLATTDTLDRLGLPEERWRVVLNRSGSRVALPAPEVDRILGRAVSAHVPSSVDVPASVNQAVPLVLASPGHPVSRAVAALARDLVRAAGPAVVDVRDLWPAPMTGRVTSGAGASAGAPFGAGRPAPH